MSQAWFIFLRFFERPNWALGAVVLAPAALLGGALWFQYVEHMPPCPLCIWQRVPHVFAIMVGLAGLAVPVLRVQVRFLLALAGLAFLATAFIAGFHVGVEQGWWAGLESCATQGGPVSDFDALKAQIMATTRVANCAEPPWIFLGLSMAAWNGIISLILAGCAFTAARTVKG